MDDGSASDAFLDPEDSFRHDDDDAEDAQDEDDGGLPPLRGAIGISNLLRVASPDLEPLLSRDLPKELQHVLLGDEEEVEWFQVTPARNKLSMSFILCVGLSSIILLATAAALVVTLPSIISYILFGIVCVFTILCWSAVIYRTSGTECDFATNIRAGKVLFNGINTISCISAPYEAVTDVMTEITDAEGQEGSVTLFCDISFSNLEFKHVTEVNVLEAILAAKLVRRPTQPILNRSISLAAQSSPGASDINLLRQSNRKCLNQFLSSHPDESIMWVNQLSFWQTMGPTLLGAGLSFLGAVAVGIALYREICCNKNSSAVAILVLLFSVFTLLPLCLVAMSLAMGVVGRIADAVSSKSIVFMRRGMFCFPMSCCNRSRLFSRPADVTLFPIGTHVHRRSGSGKIVFPRAPNLVSSTMDHVPDVRHVEKLIWGSYLNAALPQERSNKKSNVDRDFGAFDAM
jgi:hypothetical protein